MSYPLQYMRFEDRKETKRVKERGNETTSIFRQRTSTSSYPAYPEQSVQDQTPDTWLYLENSTQVEISLTFAKMRFFVGDVFIRTRKFLSINEIDFFFMSKNRMET